MGNEDEIKDAQERLRFFWINRFAKTTAVEIITGGFFAGILMGIIGLLVFVLMLMGGALLQLNMMATGFIQPNSIGESQGLPEMLQLIKTLFISGLPVFIVIGILGVVSAKCRQLADKSNVSLIFLGGLVELHYDQLVFILGFLIAFIIMFIKYSGENTAVVFTFSSTGNEYSFWMLALTYIIVSVFLGMILHTFWLNCYKFILSIVPKK
ncbi:MAG: hypothetical protein A2252_04395 [Elusimicrobia bacterium RIFOXYA2_FULL_39_19]|nr:MAG: hypothetical protein A2252_04395 [Elusimicrobia bacterium RIFOXYA2_FULL_39_19]